VVLFVTSQQIRAAQTTEAVQYTALFAWNRFGSERSGFVRTIGFSEQGKAKSAFEEKVSRGK
jgi:hypothetical protein